ncbi:MAG: response regulator transcription factor [Acholeplasmatales bacterium]|nr:response regulator transcription factor [Acholeplasmatales bacterium]MBQ4356402.1 response regulator transcription factor [Acholeplasmatales bacterium]
MKILICEDQAILLDGLILALSKEKSFEVVASIKNAKDISRTLKEVKCDLVLTDIITEEKNNALNYIKEIRDAYPNLKIVAITGFPDISFMEKAKNVGVNSFVYKNISTEELVSVIKNTSTGYSVFPNNEKTKDLIVSTLTETELKIVRLYSSGLEREEIAKELFMSNSSLKSHISQILLKTGFPSLARVAIYAISNGLVVL